MMEGTHTEVATAARDTERTPLLEEQGCDDIRFWNNEVQGNVEGVQEKISEVLK